MNKDFLNRIRMIKKSLDWWREQGVLAAFEAEELNWRYEIGELTEEELLKKSRELDDRICYLMAKGNFEHRNLFETFARNEKT